ncbi:MAG: porin [Sedimentitalea sp.]|uniref:porin n=1 Tax=Sedimentitalea sp. TaxID=2048915 RepID=UPI0032664ED9
MKKVLFATTALIALGSMAAADVRLSGYGRFGLDYNDANNDNVGDEDYNGISSTNITSRLRLQVDMSAETDGGVGFNARVRMQAESRDNQNLSNGVGGPFELLTDPTDLEAVGLREDDNGFNGARFGVTYGGLAVNVGNIIGAVENAPGLYTTGTRSAGTGIDGMGFYSVAIKDAGFDAYSSDGQGANGVEALYTMGGFTGHISYSKINDLEVNTVTNIGIPGEERTAIMLTYSFGDYYVTGAYQDSNNGPMTDAGDDINDLYFLAAGGDWGQFGAKIAYGSNDTSDSWTLEGNMDIGAASNILVWYNDADGSAFAIDGVDGVGTDGNAFGINYEYDLGGGATFVAGYVNSDYNDVDQDQFQAGVYFSF